MKTTSHRPLLGIALLLVSAVPAWAEFLTYEMVPVGDAGNAADTTGYGAVSYEYQIGKYEVTIGQYTTFLNAVAKTDLYGLYSQSLMSGYNNDEGGITQAGSSGSYFYYVTGPAGPQIPQATAANRPIAQTTWWQAARFANWMSNGQPTTGQGPTSTENGVYEVAGRTSGTAPAVNLVNPNTGLPSIYRLPTENEWYKAAYHRSGGMSSGYWDFSTQSDSAPGNVLGSGGNQANYWTGVYSVTQSSNKFGGQNYLTDVGVFVGSPSAYGTFDQTGNAWELNDLTGNASVSRGRRGGDWRSDWANASAFVRYEEPASNIYGGFRLAAPAAVPEPSTYAMALAGVACGGFSMWQRRKWA